MYMTAEGKAIKEVYQWEAKSQYRGKLLTEELSLRFLFKAKRKRDLFRTSSCSMRSMPLSMQTIARGVADQGVYTINPRIEGHALTPPPCG